MFQLTEQLLLAAGLGPIAHHAYFIHGEHDLEAANIAGFHIISSVIIAYLKRQFEGYDTRDAVLQTSYLALSYTGTMFTSIVIFRLFFSPVGHIPGPWYLRWSKFPHVVEMSYRRNCEFLDDFQDKYGSVVRTGKCKKNQFKEKKIICCVSDC